MLGEILLIISAFGHKYYFALSEDNKLYQIEQNKTVNIVSNRYLLDQFPFLIC